MDLRDSKVLILGGAGLIGVSVARRIIAQGPSRVVIGSLRQAEAEAAVEELRAEGLGEEVMLEATWGDLFVPSEYTEWSRADLLSNAEARGRHVDDVFSPLTQEVFERSMLGKVLLDLRPDVVVDCINTAGVLAYQNAFAEVTDLRSKAAEGNANTEAVERLLASLYLPQLIRHVQIALSGMSQVGTRMYLKIGTAGTGGMGLNIPFTHSEERPSRTLLAKASLAGAQTLLLYLMARTPGAPAVKEIKPTAAVSWKSIGRGPVMRGGKPLLRSDAEGPTGLAEAFGGGGSGFATLDEPLEGVFLDAGENGLFSLPEFEALTALGLMEFVTPEEIADNVLRELQSHPTGKDVVAALDAATMGPTYRAGVLRAEAIKAMESLEEEQGTASVAYEMLGPPRLAKHLFEGQILRVLYRTLAAAGTLDATEAAQRSAELISSDHDLRQRILSIGLPILLPDGQQVLRGANVKVPPPEGMTELDEATVASGWIDLRAENWGHWRDRIGAILAELKARPTVFQGSRSDRDYGDEGDEIRPGQLASWIFRTEEDGRRSKR
jgi:NAD(P)-dependent dehydrogenase (short-subunit alcohol dehydrogenase family)